MILQAILVPGVDREQGFELSWGGIAPSPGVMKSGRVCYGVTTFTVFDQPDWVVSLKASTR